MGGVLIVVAHPDDEIIGAGNMLANMSESERVQVRIVYVTDGAPRDPRFAFEAGFSSREAYLERRREERNAALRIADVTPSQCIELGYIDQEAALHLRDVADKVTHLLESLEPAMILTHPFEGGHPDHDACSFACRRALSRNSNSSARLIEFACYYSGPHGLMTQEFLSRDQDLIETNTLRLAERARKQRMYDCHRTQERVLRQFSTCAEKFRQAPHYDFRQRPHPGPLHYETLGWSLTWAAWIKSLDDLANS